MDVVGDGIWTITRWSGVDIRLLTEVDGRAVEEVGRSAGAVNWFVMDHAPLPSADPWDQPREVASEKEGIGTFFKRPEV